MSCMQALMPSASSSSLPGFLLRLRLLLRLATSRGASGYDMETLEHLEIKEKINQQQNDNRTTTKKQNRRAFGLHLLFGVFPGRLCVGFGAVMFCGLVFPC